MESSVQAALEQTLGADQDMRRQAEAALAQAETTPGVYQVLCHLAVNAASLQIQQAAVLYLKNSCKHWDPESRAPRGKSPIPQVDQTYLRTNIMQFLHAGLPAPIRAQFTKVAKLIAKSLSLREWTELLPQLDTAFLCQDLATFQAGLTLLYQVLKVVSKRLSPQRKPELGLLAERYSMSLLNWLQQLQLNAETLPCYRTILKIYFRATYIEYLGPLGVTDSISAWHTRILSILNSDLGAEGWRVKKWSLRIGHRCLAREISMNSMSVDLKTLTQLFLGNYSKAYALPAREQLRSAETPETVRHIAWKYLAQAAKSSWKETQAYVHSLAQELLETALLPQVCRVPDEEQLWTSSPSEFLHRENDFLMTASSPKYAALDFILSLSCSGQLDLVLNFISRLLEQERLAPLLKEAGLLLLGWLSSLEPMRTTHKSSVSTSLRRYALPELQSAIGFLRFRAVWLYGRFASCIQEEAHQIEVLPLICKLLLDSDLPVRVQASTTLSKVLVWSGSSRLLEPEISNLLEVFKANMELIDSEDLIDALEDLVDHYSSQVVPYASILTHKLCATFARTANQEDKMTAVPVLSVLIKLTSALKDHLNDLHAISQQLLPVVQFSLSSQGEPFMEEGLSLLGNLLGLLDGQRMGHLYALLPVLVAELTTQDGSAKEYYEQSFSPLANFISKDKSAFLSLDGVNLILNTAKRFLEYTEDGVGYEYHYAAKLLICLCENHPEVCQSHKEILREAVKFLVTKNERAWKLQGIELLSILLANDVPGTLNWLSSSCETVLKYWFDNLYQFKMNSGKAHIALCFISFLQNRDNLPEILTRNLSAIVKNLLQLLGDLSKEEHEEESDEEDDMWTPIEEELYESPVTLAVLAQMLRTAVSTLQTARPQEWTGIEAALTAAEKDTLLRLLTAR